MVYPVISYSEGNPRWLVCKRLWRNFVSKAPSGERKGWQRFFDFIEQPLFLAIASILGGIVGVTVYAPIFVISVIGILLALHRSGALSGIRPIVQVGWYILIFALSMAILVWVGRKMRASTNDFIGKIIDGVAQKIRPAMQEANQEQTRSSENKDKIGYQKPTGKAAVDAERQKHPVIKVTTTSVIYNADTREVTVKLTFLNLTSFEVEAKLHMHLLWGGPHFPGEDEMPKETAIDRIVAIGPQDNFWLTTSYTLAPEQASQWIGEKALIAVGAAATYPDRDAATEYDFAGSVRLKQNFVDVDTSHWFPRPKSVAMF
jgi:hypothetical protein